MVVQTTETPHKNQSENNAHCCWSGLACETSKVEFELVSSKPAKVTRRDPATFGQYEYDVSSDTVVTVPFVVSSQILAEPDKRNNAVQSGSVSEQIIIVHRHHDHLHLITITPF